MSTFLRSDRRWREQSTRRSFSRARTTAFEQLDARCLLAANQFAVIGDYGKGNADEADVAALVHQFNPALILTAGDNNYPLGEADTIDEKIGQFYHDYIGNYQGAYGPGSLENRFFPSLGNHDYDNSTEDAQPYLDYFTLPGNERYYDLVRGNVHFWIVNSEPQEPDGITSTSRQALWLKAGLAASTSPFDVVIYHRATYSSAHHGGNTTMAAWPLKAWGAEAVINGHDHVYERLLVGGLTYFVNGTGGAGLYAFEHSAPTPPPGASQVQYNADFGAMLLTDNGSSLTFEFWSVASGGTLVDRHTIQDNTGPGRLDVNADGLITPLDVLMIVNVLNVPGHTGAAVPVDGFNSHLDVNLDLLVSPLDVLLVVNALNNRSSAVAPSATLLDQSMPASGDLGMDSVTVSVSVITEQARLQSSAPSVIRATDSVLARWNVPVDGPDAAEYPSMARSGRSGENARATCSRFDNWEEDEDLFSCICTSTSK